MKQILMSKEEYDQLMQDIENLKREKESLVQKNSDKDKEIEKLKDIIEKVKHSHVNYLNIVTIKNAVLDIRKFGEMLENQASGYFSNLNKSFDQYERKYLYDNVLRFLKGLDYNYFNELLTYEQTVSYDWGLNTELLNGTLLDSKIKEANELTAKACKLEQERDSLLKQIKERDYSFMRKNDELREKNLQILELRQKANKYDGLYQSHSELSKEMEGYTKEMFFLKQKIEQYENERHYCIKLPEWAMRLLRRKQ